MIYFFITYLNQVIFEILNLIFLIRYSFCGYSSYLDSPLRLHHPIPAHMKTEISRKRTIEEMASPMSHLTFPGREAHTNITKAKVRIDFLS